MFGYVLQGSISKVTEGENGVVEEIENDETTDRRQKNKARETRTKRKQHTRDLMMMKNPLQRK